MWIFVLTKNREELTNRNFVFPPNEEFDNRSKSEMHVIMVHTQYHKISEG